MWDYKQIYKVLQCFYGGTRTDRTNNKINKHYQCRSLVRKQIQKIIKFSIRLKTNNVDCVEMLKGLLAKLSLQITPKPIKKQSITITHSQVGKISSLFPSRQLLQQNKLKQKDLHHLHQIQKPFQLNSLNLRKCSTKRKDFDNFRKKQLSSVLLKIKAQEQPRGEYRYIRTQSNELGAEFDQYSNPNKIFLKKLISPKEKVIDVQFAARNESWPVSAPKRLIQPKKDEYREINKLDNMGQLLQRHRNLMKKFIRVKKPKTEKYAKIKKYQTIVDL